MALTTIDDRGLKTPIDLIDNEKIRFGTGNDLEIIHNGSDSRIINTTGDLKIRSQSLKLETTDAQEYIRCTADQDVQLFYDNVVKFQTTSDGWKCGDSVKGVFGTGNDLEIYHDGSNSYIRDVGTSNLYLDTNGDRISLISDGSEGSGSMAKFIKDGAVELYWNNEKKLETYEYGVDFAQNIKVGLHIALLDNGEAIFGTGSDLKIYHDGSSSYVYDNGTGPLILGTNNSNIQIKGAGSMAHMMAEFKSTEGVELYHNNVKKFETVSDGVKITAAEGGEAILYIHADEADDNADQYRIRVPNNDGFHIEAGSSHETALKIDVNAGVQLYYDNSKKIQTASHGLDILDDVVFDNGTNAGKDINWNESSNTMRWQDDVKAAFGAGDDLQIYHDGTNSFITDDNLLVIRGDGLQLQRPNGNMYVKCIAGGAVELYHDNVKRFDTTANGVESHGNAVNTYSAIFNQTHHAGYGAKIVGNSTSNGEAFYIYQTSSNAGVFRVLWDGNVASSANSYGALSDVKLKENIVDANSQWNDLKAIKFRNFNFKDDPDKVKLLGVVAQEAETVSAGLVYDEKDITVGSNGEGTVTGTTKSVKYSILYMKAIKCLQEAQARIETLETKVAALESA